MSTTENLSAPPCLAFGDTGNTVWLTMHHGEVPETAPPSIAAVAEPQRDRGGHVADWRFRAEAGAGADAIESSFREYLRWRKTWSDDRAIGSHVVVDTFLRWADPQLDVSALHVLRLNNTHISPARVPLMCFQAERAIEFCRRSVDAGVGIFDVRSHHLLAGFLAVEPQILASHASWALQVAGGELRLVHENAEPGVAITGWRHGKDGRLEVTTASEGSTADAEVARLLQALCPLPGADVTVERTPVVKLFAPFLDALRDIARTAGSVRADLYLHTSSF